MKVSRPVNPSESDVSENAELSPEEIRRSFIDALEAILRDEQQG